MSFISHETIVLAASDDLLPAGNVLSTRGLAEEADKATADETGDELADPDSLDGHGVVSIGPT